MPTTCMYCLPGGLKPTISGRKPFDSRTRFGRDHPFREDPLVVVDVVQEHVQRPDALDQAGLEPLPFLPATGRGIRSKGKIFSTPRRSE